MRFVVSMILAILVGLAYVGWLAWVEGWRFWLVLGVMILVAVIGGAVHLAMGMARAHDGLEPPAQAPVDRPEEPESPPERPDSA